MFLKCFLTLVSVKGTHLSCNFTCNRGALLPPGTMLIHSFKALTGQNSLFKSGILSNFPLLVNCIVLVHFSKIMASDGLKKTSPLQICFKKEKELMVCGTRLESLKKPKNPKQYATLKIFPIYVKLHFVMMVLNNYISTNFGKRTLKGAVFCMALMNKPICG